MVREELITSAISFLQDPSVAQAPIEKKIAFLQAKNLTQEEIDVSLARVGEPPAAPGAVQANYPYRPPPQQGPYGGGYQGYWPPPPPPELPKRDWRDWFIMATVMGGVGYGIYFTAKRYIIPLIKPPTPPQLEQDKATIDESFERAFALLDQLNTDTTALKAAEESRTTRLDSALADLESVLGSLKEADRKREDDSRRNADEIRSLRDLIPKAIEAQKEANDTRLKELGTELKSLRTLVGNRMGGTAPPPTNGLGHRSTGSSGTGIGYTPSSTTQAVQPVQTSASIEAPALNSPTTSLNSASATSTEIVGGAPATAPVPATASSSSRFGSGRAAIPAWQMAAAKKSQEALNGEKKDTSSSGTAVEASST